MASQRIVPNGAPRGAPPPLVVIEDEEDGNLGELLESVRRIVIQNRWLILLPACCVMLATLAVTLALPDRYKSEAMLLVVQQQVPERYVTPNSTTPVAAELQAMKQEVLSRSRLHDIIRQFGLYPTEVKKYAPEKMLELIQKDIDIIPLVETSTPSGKDYNAFKISFTADNPTVAQQVTSTLTSLFIKENLKTRADQATNTTSFLHEQLEVAKQKLEEQDRRVRDFKMEHLGELPEQQQGNLGILTGLQIQLQNTMATISRAQEQRVYLETLLNGYQAMRPRATVINSNGIEVKTAPTPVDNAQAALIRLQSERAALLSGYTATHPDVTSKDREIAVAQAALRRLQAEAPKEQPTPKTARNEPAEPVPSVADQPAVAQLKSQLESNRLELGNLAKEEVRLKASLVQYQERLNQTPVREQQLSGLLRDYELQKHNYTDLLNKELQSQLATNLEKDQGGRQFRLVDPPSLPQLPSSPNRMKINLGGMAGGIFLGLALAFVRGMRDQAFYTEKALQRFDLPLTVSVPVLLTSSEKRSRRWRMAFEWCAGSLMMLSVLAVEAYFLRNFR